MELGALRYAQGFDAYEILKEYEILGGILFSFLAPRRDAMPEKCEKSELLACGHRVFRAIALIQQATTTHYLGSPRCRCASARSGSATSTARCRTRSRTASATVLGAGDVLHEIPTCPPAQRARFVDIIRRNARAMQSAVDNILTVTRQDHAARQQRNILLAAAATEAIRQLRDAAQASGVEVRMAESLPDVEVNAAGVELCLTNYLSNAIKYADPAKRRAVGGGDGHDRGTGRPHGSRRPGAGQRPRRAAGEA